MATDESSDGLHAVRMARSLAVARGVPLTILSVRPPSVPSGGRGERVAGHLLSSGSERPPHLADELTRFQRWLGAEARNSDLSRPEVAVAFGVPGLEIVRRAGERGAALVVLGRQARAPDQPVSLGETADAVVRRNDRPTLFVPANVEHVRTVLLAMDGSERALPAFETALDVARTAGAGLDVLTVEPALADEPDGSLVPRGRTEKVRLLVEHAAARGDEGPAPRLLVRRGDPIEQILGACGELRPDVLVIGYRRGGPPKVIGPTDIARTLLFAAPCAVLTVPV